MFLYQSVSGGGLSLLPESSVAAHHSKANKLVSGWAQGLVSSPWYGLSDEVEENASGSIFSSRQNLLSFLLRAHCEMTALPKYGYF